MLQRSKKRDLPVGPLKREIETMKQQMRFQVIAGDSASRFLSMNQQGLSLGAITTNKNKPDPFLYWSALSSVEKSGLRYSPRFTSPRCIMPRSTLVQSLRHAPKKILLDTRRSYVVELIHQKCSMETAPFCWHWSVPASSWSGSNEKSMPPIHSTTTISWRKYIIHSLLAC